MLSLSQQTVPTLTLSFKQYMLRNMQIEVGDESANTRVGKAVARLRKGMSQAELARRLAKQLGKPNVDPTTITRIERGKRAITVDELAAFAQIFGVPESDLLEDSELAARLAKLNVEYRDLLDYYREHVLLKSRLLNAAEEVRRIVFDAKTRDEEVREHLDEKDLAQIREDLTRVQRVLAEVEPWPVRVEEVADGAYRIGPQIELDDAAT